MNIVDKLHNSAIELAKAYKKTENDLLTVLMEMDEKRVFLSLGFTGIFNYCFQALKLSEAQSSYFASVARKSKEVPQLKEAIDRGKLSLSQARRITSVITQATQEEWIAKSLDAFPKAARAGSGAHQSRGRQGAHPDRRRSPRS